MLWRRASLFAPTSAHRELLKVSSGGALNVRKEMEFVIRESGRRDLYDLLIHDPNEFGDSYAELRVLHVLSRVEGFNGERWAMHRLVRDYGRAQMQPGEVMIHSIAFSEWLKNPTLPLELEAPHFVVAILDSARYVGEFEFGRYGGRKSLGREIATRAFYKDDDRYSLPFDPREFIYFIRDELRNPKALTIIFEGLSDMNEDVRLQAIRLLESIGPIPEVLEGLASSLGDPDPEVRGMAERSLVKYGGDKTVNILVAAMQSPKPSTRLGAVRALGLMGKKAHNALKEALGNDNLQVRIESALLLCEQGNIAGTETLINEIGSVGRQEQERFIDALGAARDPRGVLAIRRFLSFPRCRSNAIRALGKIAPVPEAIEGLISCLKLIDIDNRTYEMAIHELAEHSDNKTISMLNETVQGPNARARIGAIRALGLIGTKAHRHLRDALQSEDSQVRIEAALLLCEQGQKDGVRVLIENIQSVSEGEQKRFINALGKARDRKAIPTISEFLFNAQHRIDAIRALGEIGPPPEAIEGLIGCFGNADPRVCELAINALVSMGEKAHGALRAALESENVQLSLEAALLLCERGWKEGTETVVTALKLESKQDNLSSGNYWPLRRCMVALGNIKATEAISAL